MRPIRVLQVVRPASGVMRSHVLALASGLTDEGVISEIACPGDSALIKSALTTKATVHPLPLKGAPHLVHDAETVLVLRELMRQRRYDVVHAHGYKAAAVARVAARLAGMRRVLVTAHRTMMDRRDIDYRAKKRFVSLERRLARRTPRYIAAYQAVADEIVEAFGVSPRRVEVIGTGYDLSAFTGARTRADDRSHYGIPHDAVAFGLAGKFAPERGMDLVARVAVSVCERLPYAWFVMAGDGPMLEPVRKIARDAGLADRILFPGYDTDVAGLLSALDAYVSVRTGNRPRRTLIEAAAAGRPIVAFRSKGTSEAIEDGVTGLLVTAGDEAELGEAVMRLARDTAVRANMGDAARARAVERFSTESMLARTLELYREVS